MKSLREYINESLINESKIKAEFTKFSKKDNWVKGIVGDYKFEAKLFDEPSMYGINDGRVSKLSITDKQNNWVINYDRGWDIEVTKKTKPYFDAVMELLEKSPKRFLESLKEHAVDKGTVVIEGKNDIIKYFKSEILPDLEKSDNNTIKEAWINYLNELLADKEITQSQYDSWIDTKI